MDDSWSFRTERGRARVADGHLRVEGSARGLLEATYREKWVRADRTRKSLFLFSLAGMATWFGRVIPAARALVGPSPVSPLQWIVLSSAAFVALLVVRRVGRSERIPLARVESVTRTGRSFTVEYDDGGNADGENAGGARSGTLEIDALTDDDAEQAGEILRLKGVPVERRREDAEGERDSEGGRDDEDDERAGFRDRLAEKDERSTR